jgi:glucose/arabinose dehydrogenase
MPTRRRTSLLAPALLALTLLLPLLVVPATTASAAGVAVSWAPRARGLSQPVYVGSARDSTGRMFIVEKTGKIKVYLPGGTVRTYLDLSDRISTAGEGGLLSIAFQPNFKTYPYIWVTYALPGGGALRVARYRSSGAYTSNTASKASGVRILDVPHPTSHTNHWGGQLAFGKDGYLYISTGDGGDGGANARNLNSLSGKILRINVRATCGGTYYCVPSTNPYAAQTGVRRLVWARGLRNPWRFSIERTTGDLWIADVGQSTWEEVSRLAYGVKGADLGWNTCEAWAVNGSTTQTCPLTGASYVGPSYWYGRSYGAAIIGGFRYYGVDYPSLLTGKYVGGDFVSGRIFTMSGGTRTTVGSLPNVTGFGETQRREIWAVTIDGGAYKLTARAT